MLKRSHLPIVEPGDVIVILSQRQLLIINQALTVLASAQQAAGQRTLTVETACTRVPIVEALHRLGVQPCPTNNCASPCPVPTPSATVPRRLLLTPKKIQSDTPTHISTTCATTPPPTNP